MAGFRIGRGRDNRTRTPQHPPRQQPYGPGQQAPPPYGGQQWRAPGGDGHGEPEYFGDPYHHGAAAPGPAAHYDNNPGHTQMFSVGEAPDAYAPGPQDPYNPGQTYRAGDAAAPPAGPRLSWKQLLTGIVLRPNATFFQMRDYPVWGPALIVTFLYGMLAIFGFNEAREDAISATLSTAVPYVLTTGAAVVISGLILGAVTHTMARQLGGDGAWQPTVGLSMLIMCITDAPRLLVAVFMGGDASFVQLLGWLSWVAAGFLFTTMVSKSHDLPWPKALGASAIQLIALLSLIKLGTI
ncbi:Yip1 family protein [Streptomyces sp. GC420]|uniref:Yip1 family protein n=1 Tax=Streptomyces sp. GC420 TaxID=2697568 RepID=UPI001414F281|nr:Yip1 family protein [Streptomyces sp. GC420]NBM15111.1 YIP1 family protein [Streptomyces sp. GC420]